MDLMVVSGVVGSRTLRPARRPVKKLSKNNLHFGETHGTILAVTYKQIIRFFGSRAAAAERLEVSRQLLYHWEKHGIPRGRQALIQLQTDGALRAERSISVPKVSRA